MKLQRWAFLKELIPLVLTLVALDYFVFEGKLLSWEPTPLWLLVLLIAPRCGSIAGFACGIVAAALYLWTLSEQGYLWQDLLHRQPASLVMPGLFLLFGASFGALSERQTKRMEHFRDKAAALAGLLDSSEINRAKLEQSCIEIEKRTTGQGVTLLTLHDSFKKLGNAASEEELLFALDIVLRDESKAESCGIWRITQERHEFIAGRFDGNIPPIALAVRRNYKVINAADWSLYEEAYPGADLAALILDNESERLVVALTGVPFAHLTRDFVLRFGLLAEHAELMLEILRDREILQNRSVLDKESGLVSETYLRRRVDEEAALARRHKMPLSLLACSISGSRENTQSRLKTALFCSIRACIRSSDGLAWFPNKKAFVMLLPWCDEKGAGIVLKKIKANLKNLDLRDENNHEIYETAWSILACDNNLKGNDLLAHLLSDMHKEACA